MVPPGTPFALCWSPGTYGDHVLGDRSDRIDPNRLRLLWEQVADDLRADIKSGALRPGAKLPGDPELAGQYGVSRITVRRAIKALEAEGLLVVMMGRGTYVAGR